MLAPIQPIYRGVLPTRNQIFNKALQLVIVWSGICCINLLTLDLGRVISIENVDMNSLGNPCR